MQSISYEGFTAVVQAQVPGSDGLMYVSLVGNSVSARAIAAALLSLDCRKHDSGIQIGGHNVHLERHAHYKVLVQQADRRGKHGITTRVHVLHNALTTQNVDAPTLYFLMPEGQDAISPGFFRRLRLAVKIPLLPEWEGWLWSKGQQPVTRVRVTGKVGTSSVGAVREEVTPIKRNVKAKGVTCWQVAADPDAWVEVIRDHLGLGRELAYTGQYRYADGEWELRLEANVWRMYRQGEQLMKDDKVAHGSRKINEVLNVAQALFGEKLILKGGPHGR